MRVPDDGRLPARGAWRDDWPVPALDPATLTPLLVAARAQEQAYRAAFHANNEYDLLARNCATELLRGAEQGLGDDAGDETASAHLDPDGVLNFIPFVAAHAVGTHYPIAATYEAPSYRRSLSAGERSGAAYLREVNVLTSRTYRWHRGDPVFLLFTDGTPLLRPLFGAANLATGALATIAGIVALPADSGALLRNALDGMFYSVPELAFISIRKGSFPVAPRGWLSSID
jgi:hypothetical protein